MVTMHNSVNAEPEDTMTMSALRRQEKEQSLWVLNTSDLMGTREQGDILIEVVLGGKVTVITVPKTWIPIDLSAFARREVILESPSFSSAVQRLSLTPLKPEFAERVTALPEVRDEQNLLALKASGLNSLTTAVPGRTPGAQRAPNGIQQPLLPMAQGDVLDAVNPRIISVMESDSAAMTPAIKLSSLKSMVNEITGKDLRYILSKCGPEHETISKWVNEIARAMRAAGNPDV